jgi:hypothetical protein
MNGAVTQLTPSLGELHCDTGVELANCCCNMPVHVLRPWPQPSTLTSVTSLQQLLCTLQLQLQLLPPPLRCLRFCVPDPTAPEGAAAEEVAAGAAP